MTSDNTYTYEEKVFDGGGQNLDDRYDERYTHAPTWADKPPHMYPPAGADAAITVNPVVKFVDKATQSINATKQAIAFHELVEAYHRVDKNMPYGDFDTYGAHFAAKEPERIMRMQRPSWTTHPAGGCATQK